MQHFSNKTLNGKYFEKSQNLIGIVQLTDILSFYRKLVWRAPLHRADLPEEAWPQGRKYLSYSYTCLYNKSITSFSVLCVIEKN